MKQEMTAIPDKIRYENAPSKEMQDSFFRDGYEKGLVKGRIEGLEQAIEIIIRELELNHVTK